MAKKETFLRAIFQWPPRHGDWEFFEGGTFDGRSVMKEIKKRRKSRPSYVYGAVKVGKVLTGIDPTKYPKGWKLVRMDAKLFDVRTLFGWRMWKEK